MNCFKNMYTNRFIEMQIIYLYKMEVFNLIDKIVYLTNLIRKQNVLVVN